MMYRADQNTSFVKTLFICIFLLSVNSVISQNSLKGIWLICDDFEKCSDQTMPLYMEITDSLICEKLILDQSLPGEVTSLYRYHKKNDTLTTFHTTETGLEYSRDYLIIFIEENKVELRGSGQISTFLKR